jgi:hypothetical protein
MPDFSDWKDLAGLAGEPVILNQHIAEKLA